MKKMLTYGAGLIAVYLIVRNPMGVSSLAKDGGGALAGLVKAFQGR